MRDLQFIAKIRKDKIVYGLTVADLTEISRMVIAGDLIHVDEARDLVAQWDAEERADAAVDAARGVA
jgi:hypothetical protein